jgi:hypothetical protein
MRFTSLKIGIATIIPTTANAEIRVIATSPVTSNDNTFYLRFIILKSTVNLLNDKSNILN